MGLLFLYGYEAVYSKFSFTVTFYFHILSFFHVEKGDSSSLSAIPAMSMQDTFNFNYIHR